ncbi:hypothetical protein C2S53_013489 [Perilla frutescens var. hirtella]|uniref:NB-ARC domain-containing protein n=1 Tax=Perilla frutescens var. hirtella TaxID=608512 RepID=A0AAD4J889_PERFH|nr:hypothetical protein C2S53_013489 [Perilla frutescens var. hirtella]
MAGYGAVVSLQQTINRILESSRISLLPPSAEIIQLTYRELTPLQKTLKRLDRISKSKSRKKVNALDGRIKQAVWRFEDLLESHLSHQILSQQSEIDCVHLFSVDLQSLQHDVDSFIETVKDMEKMYVLELGSLPEVEEDESVSSRYDFGGSKAKMVGFSHLFDHAMDCLIREENTNYAYSLVGMPGSGKTTLADKLFRDPEVSRWFDHRVWVTVGRKYELREIKRHILAQLHPHIDEITQGDDKISEILKGTLERKRCLIVLDNVWDTEVLDHLRNSLPEKNNAVIRILLTTNLYNVAHHLSSYIVFASARSMPPLNEKESEDLLREKVFGEDARDFPHKLKKAAKKIAKNCDALPLMIVTVAHLLSIANKNDDPGFWNEVAENRNSGVMMEAHNQISKVLFPVYDCSPQSLKMLYLYLGAFPRDYEIPASKLMILLTAEGFLQQQTFDEIFDTKMHEFARMHNVVIFKQSNVNYRYVKACSLNPSWWHLFNREASKEKFLRVLNSGGDGLQGQRRLCLHSNFLFSFKEVNNLIKCDCASTARSLLCYGPYHPYSMPLDVGFKLLRVLDALKVRFYSFPVEILELVLLQYLALTYNGELPTSITKLFNLEILIIHPHVSIKSCGAPSNSYVPVQIWDMKELKHTEILGSNLPNPNCDVSLQKLSTLLGVSATSCTREVLTKLPNITKLGIQIELMPESGISIPLSFFSPFAELKNLDTLKCSVVNPELEYGSVAFLNPLWMIPSRLRKLHLSGLGYPWKDMEVIGLMPNLKVLKLRCYAFQGPKWETFGGPKRGSFLCLEYLVIEDTDLVEWEPGHGSFPKLCKLSIKHCYELEELRWPDVARSGVIEMVDCNPLAVTCAKKLKPTYEHDILRIISSFEELK